MCVGVWLPITLSACAVEFFVSVCVQERTATERKREAGGPDWDKGLCSHECHTNKAQSDIEVQPVR